jgi:formylglycine-generating enzyme required for sulfatase activity
MVRSSAVSSVTGGPLWVQETEVTLTEWARCHAAEACDLAIMAPDGATSVAWPATGLNAEDAAQYIAWLRSATGHRFRLPTEAEWYELAGAMLPKAPPPLFSQPELTWAADYQLTPSSDRRLRPTGGWSRSGDGIADLDGNVWEWTQDCIVRSRPERCAAFIVGGTHRAVIPYLVRDPANGGCAVGLPPPYLGMRVVSDDPVPRN